MIGEILGELVWSACETVGEAFIEAIITPDKEVRAAKKAGAKKAGKIIKDGGIVAFPTETVYGLGADAFNPEAVSRIYMAKGRPNDNPLILHIAKKDKFFELAENPPEYAKKLIDVYWPGPLTLVVRKKLGLPSWLGSFPQNQTETIGIRMPKNTIARVIIEYSKTVVAAPSANKAGKPSPTAVSHISFENKKAATPLCGAWGSAPLSDGNCESNFLANEIDMIVDGGTTTIGLESTVVDVTGDTPIILRPGAVTAEMIKKTTGIAPIIQTDSTNTPKSPGMKYRHYAPNAPMTIISGDRKDVVDYMYEKTLKNIANGKKVGLLVTNSTKELMKKAKLFEGFRGKNIKIITFGDEFEIIAQKLFASLRQFDTLEVSEIFAEAVPNTGLGEAIMNRMFKAAEGRVEVVTT